MLDRTNFNGPINEPRPLIWRETESATEINRILNDADVFPLIKVAGQENFDLSSLVADPNDIFLRCDGGVVFFIADMEQGSGIYEGHTNFLKGHRGAYALRVTIAAIDWLFTHTIANFLFARIPTDNHAAIQNMRHLRRAGVERWFDRRRAWPADEGLKDLRYYCLTLHAWLARSAMLGIAGKFYREHLEAEFRRHGVPREATDDDPAYDRAFAAAIEMLKGGQPFKGLVLFNRWARAAGYPMLLLVSEVPLVVDTGEAMLHVTGDAFKIIKVH